MRTVMTLFTLAAASIGYLYLQQTPAAGEAYSTDSTAPALFDWSRDAGSRANAARVPMNELVGRIHERTRSVLDDFANQHGGHSDAPVDDAFERLRQVTISASTPNDRDNANDGGANWSQPAKSPLPTLDQLQRTAFEPVAVSEEKLPDATEPKAPQPDQEIVGSVDNPATTITATPPTTTTTVTPPTTTITVTPPPNDNVEANVTSTRTNPLKVRELTKSDLPVSTVLQTGNRPAAKRPVDNQAVWKVVGKTTEGRPMHTMHLGDRGTRTLIIAGLNGTDRTGVRWLELLAENLAQHPALLSKNEVVFFRAGNPDGLTRNMRNNARGVPIDRNFPGRRYRPMMDLPSFATPAGELETRVILDTLYSFRPRRVIVVTATTGNSQVLYNRSAAQAAGELERAARLKISPLDAEQLPGSLEDFADGTLEAAVLSLRLGVGNDWLQTWKGLQPSVLSAVVGVPLDEDGNEIVHVDPDRTPIPAATLEPVSLGPRRKGYEELPPPPQ